MNADDWKSSLPAQQILTVYIRQDMGFESVHVLVAELFQSIGVCSSSYLSFDEELSRRDPLPEWEYSRNGR